MRVINKPIYSSGLCKHCGSRWHLSEYCPCEYKGEVIQITQAGDLLRCYPNGNMDNETLLAHCIAIHHVCGGFVDLKPTTYISNAIICRACKLRIVIPNIIETFGELRKFFSFNES